MTLKSNNFDLLERKFAIYVLVALSEHPYSTKVEITHLEPGNVRTKFQRLTELSAAGYIDYVRSENFRGERMVLTRDAEELVAYLKKVKVVLDRRKTKPDYADD